ncbi:MAG: hypothetical protein HYY18_23035 [Planctomycetes bacterium]|nr:hypothetical protein [Planctomycetota bacterium]
MTGTTTEPKEAAPARSRWRGLKRRAIVYAALPSLGLVVIAVWVIAPLLICQRARDLVGARILGKFDVKWASLGFDDIELRGITLTHASGRVLGRAERMILSYDRPLWGEGKRRVNRLTLIRPEFRLTLAADGRWDLQDILALEHTEDTEASPLEIVDVVDGRIELQTGAGTAVFHGVNGRIGVEPRRFVLDRLEGLAYTGRISSSGWVGTHGNDGWALQFNVAGAGVEELARGTALESRKLGGKLDAFLTLDRIADGPPLGAGWLEVREGRLYEIPVLLSVFNVLRLEAPGETVIDTTRCDFKLRADRVEVERMQFLSRGPCLFGGGDILFEGRRVDLTFVPRFATDPPDGLEALDESEEPVGDFIRRNFLVCIEVHGTWTEPVAETVPLRVISKPLKAFFRALGGGKERK